MTRAPDTYPEPPPLPETVLARALAIAESYDPLASAWPTLNLLFRLYRRLCVGRLLVIGRERLAGGARLVVANHARVSDLFLMSQAIGRFQVVMQVESYTLRGFGRLLARAGTIPVIPGRGREAIDQALEVLRRGGTVLIYPEGRLSHGGPMTRGHTGAARLSLLSGAPIQPVAVHVDDRYVRAIRGRFYGRPTLGMWQFGGPATIVIGEPWRPLPAGIPDGIADARAATDEIMARLDDLLLEAQQASV